MNRSGIVYNDIGGNPTYLPLEQVRVKAIIVDVSARVTIFQTYGNTTNVATNRCKYRFPVPANGAICGFSLRTSDGRTITGVSKAKDKATEEFEEALRTGKFAGKLDYITDDVFTVSVGCIPAQTTIEVKLTYVMTLANHDNLDEVRFQIPMTIGERYGAPPSELIPTHAPNTNTRVKITVQIQMSGRIQAITSPSHPDGISETKYPTDIGRPSRRRSTVKFQPRHYLDRDFVLVIHAEGLDTPRCFAELYQNSDRKEPDTIAMQLTIVPRFDLPPVGSQEYIFVVDRSGSMAGERINMAKRTLNILLRMLPAKGTTFNIFSFGSHSDGLWTQSSGYDQNLLNVATVHVNTMEANYGGTEIRTAVEHALASRTANMPSAIFILTDGEAYDVDETCKVVRHAVQSAPTRGPLRVFTLGIGNTVSSAMCEGIARAGDGVCLFAVDTESILGKCARLFRAGRTPFVKNVTVDWGIPEEYLSRPSMVNFIDHPPASGTKEPLPAVQQVPTHINDIHAGHMLNISVILSLRKSRVPNAVILRGELDGGETFSMTVPILAIQLRDAEPSLPWVHTLVAWRLIQEHEAKRGPLPQAGTLMSNDDIRKVVIIHLGEKYQLTSRHTSFVAIDEGQNDSRRSRATMSAPSPHSRSPSPQPGPIGASTNSTFHSSLGSIFRSFLAGIFGFGLNSGNLGQGVPGAWLDESSPSSLPISENGDDSDGHESIRTFSTLSSLEGSDDWTDSSPPSSPSLNPQINPDEPDLKRSLSPQFVPAHLAPEDVRLLLPQKPPPTAPPPPPPMAPEVINLIKMQSFDGSFPLQELRGLFGNKAIDEANNLNVDDRVWATALSIAFIKKQMGNQKELLSDLTVKALEFLQGTGLEVKEVVRRAEAALAQP